MYRFQIYAPTYMGESIGLVGAIPELGAWDIEHCVKLQTNGDRYPFWWVDLDLNPDQIDGDRLEYKYVRFNRAGTAQWESFWGNRWLPLDTVVTKSSVLIVDGGGFDYPQSAPYGYWEKPVSVNFSGKPEGLKIAVLGSSVALGCNAWLLEGWAWQLGKTLAKNYGHQFINLSEIGANIHSTIRRFEAVIPTEKPDILIIALSLGNEGFAHCPAHERNAVQRRFENGFQRLLTMIRELDIFPVIGGIYPHGDYTEEHLPLLLETQTRMKSWGVPILDWWNVLADEQGRWRDGLALDPAHPNTVGHRLMYEAIALDLFELDRPTLEKKNKLAAESFQKIVFKKAKEFGVETETKDHSLRITNNSEYSYYITPDWNPFQKAFQDRAGLNSGLYLIDKPQKNSLPFVSVGANKTIETTLEIPANSTLEYFPVHHFLLPQSSETLFYDGNLAILKQGDRQVRMVNESDHEYNVQPMWTEVTEILKALPIGVYSDFVHPDTPFRTLMIDADGLASRVKIPAKSSVIFEYRCKLSEIKRVGILSLGDRCATRMMLYKMDYDGPAYPFDLTRTTNLGDVADIIEQGFEDMWNPYFLHYSQEERRIYHGKWSGLSFAHEVEDNEYPEADMTPVYERMKRRYSGRAKRFLYTLNHCDEVLFVRTGGGSRGQVIDLLHKLKYRCQDKPFRLLIFSLQSSEEFVGLENVIHYNMYFNPDYMYGDRRYWLECTEIMREILDSLNISSKNLYWCPPKLPANP